MVGGKNERTIYSSNLWPVWLPKHELFGVLPFKDPKHVLIPALNNYIIFMLGALSCSVLTSFLPALFPLFYAKCKVVVFVLFLYFSVMIFSYSLI